MTKKFAVLGSPIEHSPSPKIHNFIFESRGVDANYVRFDVGGELESFLATKPDYQGFSVTMPLKDAAFALSIELSEVARITKSVNTLIRFGEGFFGSNTDVMGIQNAIATQPESIAVLGSGATARSALAAFPAATKLLFARNPESSAVLAGEFGAQLVNFDDALESEVVISTLPPAALPSLIDQRHIKGTLLDVAYTNPEIKAGRYVSGLLMLIHQAIGQQRLFNFGDENKPLENEDELLESLLNLLSMAK